MTRYLVEYMQVVDPGKEQPPPPPTPLLFLDQTEA